MVHGSIAIPGRTEHDEVVITTEEIAASGLDYLALGSLALDADGQGRRRQLRLRGRARGGRARPGPRRQGAPRRARRAGRQADRHDRAIDRSAGPGSRRPRSTRRRSTASRRSSRSSPPRADPDLVLDVKLVGIRRDELDLDPLEMETSLTGSFLKVRLRDGSVPGADRRAAALARHDRRGVHPRPGGADRRARGGPAPPTRPPRRATRSGSAGCCSPAARSRCEGPPAALGATSGATATFDIDLAPGLTVVRGPNESGKTHRSSARSSWP